MEINQNRSNDAFREAKWSKKEIWATSFTVLRNQSRMILPDLLSSKGEERIKNLNTFQH